MNEPMPDLTDQDRAALTSYDNLAEHGYGERDEDRELADDETLHLDGCTLPFDHEGPCDAS
jgi:hypothetical protein